MRLVRFVLPVVSFCCQRERTNERGTNERGTWRSYLWLPTVACWLAAGGVHTPFNRFVVGRQLDQRLIQQRRDGCCLVFEVVVIVHGKRRERIVAWSYECEQLDCAISNGGNTAIAMGPALFECALRGLCGPGDHVSIPWESAIVLPRFVCKGPLSSSTADVRHVQGTLFRLRDNHEMSRKPCGAPFYWNEAAATISYLRVVLGWDELISSLIKIH